MSFVPCWSGSTESTGAPRIGLGSPAKNTDRTAEGVDLHLSCRYVIHHDLCQNPSTLEQRTGRIDRPGANAERCRWPIYLPFPYVAETQDEKMQRVVTDRQRWFSVVMGEQYGVDGRATDALAERIPLPQSIADALAFRLEVR